MFLTSDRVGSYGVEPLAMYNLRGTLSLWLDAQYGKTVSTISWAVYLLACAVILLIWYALRNAKRTFSFDLVVAMSILFGTLFGVHVNPQDGLFLIVALLFFFNYLRGCKQITLAENLFFLGCPLMLVVGHYGVSDLLKIRVPVLLMLITAVWMGRTWYFDVMKAKDT